MVDIITIPAFETNYLWLGINRENNTAFVVDPGDAKPVLVYLQAHGLQLTTILLTHKHADHIGGVRYLKSIYPEVRIYGHPIEAVTDVTDLVHDDQQIRLDDFNLSFRVIHVPGHTLGHVAYYSAPMLFCGDTLFGAGCGRLFEGTAEQMLHSLSALAALPDETLVYCAHEYTLSNLEFAAHVESSNMQVQQRIAHTEQLKAQDIPSVPSTIALEKATNPFLRCDQPEIVRQVEGRVQKPCGSTVEVFRQLRLWKNNF